MSKATLDFHLRAFVFVAAMFCGIAGFITGLLVVHHFTAADAVILSKPEQARRAVEFAGRAAGIAAIAVLEAMAVAFLVAWMTPIDDEAPGP
jgi:hypothetical protein